MSLKSVLYVIDNLKYFFSMIDENSLNTFRSYNYTVLRTGADGLAAVKQGERHHKYDLRVSVVWDVSL